MRASSWNQISMGLPWATPAKWAFSVVGKFFERCDGLPVLSRVAGTGADVAEPEPVQDLAHRALVIGHPEALGDEALQVDPPPAHDAMHGPIRTGLDELGQLGLLRGRQARRMALGPGVPQPVRAALVEAVNPVTQGLAVHAADARRICPTYPVQDRREGQKASALTGVLRGRGQSPEFTGRVVRSHAHRGWHGANPPRTMKSAQRVSRKTRESQAQAIGIRSGIGAVSCDSVAPKWPADETADTRMAGTFSAKAPFQRTSLEG